MKVSRETAIRDMEEVRRVLSGMIRDLKDPKVAKLEGDKYIEESPFPKDERGHPVVPPSLCVDEVPGILSDQFRAELHIAAAKLDTLATT
jgi:hypothetical protein